MDQINLHSKDVLLAEYQSLKPTLEALCPAVAGVLSRILPGRFVVATSHRVKKFDSFYEKANKVRDERLRYDEPLKQITDLVGFRVVVIARRNVDQVCELTRQNFEVLEEENKADRLLSEGRLGYESHHLIVRLGQKRTQLGEYQGLCEIPFEIQVRTALQHAWAENEHRVQYKTTRKDPELQKRFLRLAGVVSSADEEFDRIYEINERLEQQVRDSFEQLPTEPNAVGTEVKGQKKNDIGARLKEAATMFGMSALDLVRNGRYSEAIQVYDRFINLQPTQPSHFAGRARAKALSGDIDGALDDLTESDRLAPNNAAVRNVLNILDSIAPIAVDPQSADNS
jgi:putative GTP pyrophosphokinase